MRFRVSSHGTVKMYAPLDREADRYVTEAVKPDQWQRFGEAFVLHLPDCPALEARLRRAGATLTDSD